jgi:hypothetical protein
MNPGAKLFSDRLKQSCVNLRKQKHLLSSLKKWFAAQITYTESIAEVQYVDFIQGWLLYAQDRENHG